MPHQRDLVEDLVFECLERLAAGGRTAVDALLAGQPEDVRQKVRETMAMLERVGLAGEGTAGAEPGQFGPYRLLERIGSGAMGVVYRARRADADGRDLAVKLMQPGLLPGRGNRLRFEREIRALRELDHPGICPILDDGEHDGVPFLVMPFVPGPSLREWFRATQLRDDARDRLLAALQQVAEALHHAHERGFVHRDVKPGNVILSPDGRAVLLDFGLARLDRPQDDDTLTASGGVVGTPAYMAPEQVAGRAEVDRRCDVYALGAMLYEGVTGRLPHEAPTRESLYRRILAGDVVRPSSVVPELTASVDAVCLTALASDPARRYQDARALAEEIGRLRAGERPAARLPGAVERARRFVRRYPLVSALLALLTVAVVGIAVLAAVIDRAANADRVRLSAAESLRFVGTSGEAVAVALELHDACPLPETLSAVQSALVAERPERSFPPLDSSAAGMDFSPDDRWLLVHTESGQVHLFDLGQSDSAARRVLDHGGAIVRAAAFAPRVAGDAPFVTGTADGRVFAWIWDQPERAWQRPVFGDGTAVLAVAWSADGRRLLCAAANSVRVLSAAGEVLGEVSPAGRVTRITWLDADRFAVAVDASTGNEVDHRVTIWRADASGATLVDELPRLPPLAALHANPDPARSDLLLVAAASGSAWIWDLAADGTTTLTPPERPFGGDLVAAGWCHDGASVFLSAVGGRSEVFTAAGRSVRTVGSRLDEISQGLASPASPVFALIGGQGILTLCSFEGWNVRSLGRRRLRDGPMAFTHDGARLATSTWLHEVQLWRLFDPGLPAFHAGGTTRAVAFTDAGRTVVQANTGDSDGAVRSWDLASGRQRSATPGRRVLGLVVDPAGERAVVVENQGLLTPVRLFGRQGDAWRAIGEMPDGVFRGYCFAAAFVSPRHALLCDTDGAVVLWDPTTDEHLRLPQDGALRVRNVDYRRWRVATATADATTIWVGGAPGYLHRFDRGADGSYREAPPMRFGDSVQSLCLLPDGSLTIGGGNGTLERLSPDGRRTSFRRHRTRVSSIASTMRDGALLLASGDDEGLVCFWNADGQIERWLEGDHGTVYGIQFSPDGAWLLVGTGDGAARVLPARTEDLLQLARRRSRSFDSGR